MPTVEELKQKLAEAEQKEIAKKATQRVSEIHNAVNAYKAIHYREREIEDAEHRLGILCRMLDEQQFQEYVELTTIFDAKQSEIAMKKLEKDGIIAKQPIEG
jgi:hypothetical protein